MFVNGFNVHPFDSAGKQAENTAEAGRKITCCCWMLRALAAAGTQVTRLSDHSGTATGPDVCIPRGRRQHPIFRYPVPIRNRNHMYVSPNLCGYLHTSVVPQEVRMLYIKDHKTCLGMVRQAASFPQFEPPLAPLLKGIAKVIIQMLPSNLAYHVINAKCLSSN